MPPIHMKEASDLDRYIKEYVFVLLEYQEHINDYEKTVFAMGLRKRFDEFERVPNFFVHLIASSDAQYTFRNIHHVMLLPYAVIYFKESIYFQGRHIWSSNNDLGGLIESKKVMLDELERYKSDPDMNAYLSMLDRWVYRP